MSVIVCLSVVGELWVAPSGERLLRKGRHGIIYR